MQRMRTTCNVQYSYSSFEFRSAFTVQPYAATSIFSYFYYKSLLLYSALPHEWKNRKLEPLDSSRLVFPLHCSASWTRRTQAQCAQWSSARTTASIRRSRPASTCSSSPCSTRTTYALSCYVLYSTLFALRLDLHSTALRTHCPQIRSDLIRFDHSYLFGELQQ